MAKVAHPSISLWARAEPFAYGIFQVHPHPRLAVHNIKKLVSYAKSKGKLGFPKLSYPIWKHVACNKLQLTEDLAWVLFHTCLTMATCGMERLRDIEERLYQASSTSDQERVKSSQSIELFTFVLFLYIQQINKISLKASAVSANAEWPGSHNRSSELDSGRSTPIRPCRNLDEQYHLQFVTENLTEMLDLLVEPDGYGLNGVDAFLSEEAIDSLNLIYEGTADQGRSLSSFSELVRMPSIQHATGYVKATRAYHLRGLHGWIRNWLTSNPFSVENCIRSGRRLTWRLPHQSVTGGSTNTGVNAQTQQQQQPSDISKRQKIATNAHQVPRSGGRGGNKLVVMSMISRQIIARSSATLDGATLKIQRAHCSYLYLLSPMRSVTLDKCRKLTIVLGPIENTLQLNHCEDCLVISACRRAVLAACRRCTLHLCIPSRPILIQPPLPTVTAGGALSPNMAGSSTPPQTMTNPGTPTPAGVVAPLGNEEILLAPFHTTYLRLTDHMMRVNLSAKVNYWDQPFLLGQDSNKSESSAGVPIPGRGRYWDLLRPSHFYPFNIPLLVPTKTDPPETSDSPSRATNSQLDLSAVLVTDTNRFFVDLEGADDYVKTANNLLPVPLPTLYLEALRERASIYQKWPQHIANARLTTEQRQIFGTLVDQRFRQWLSESGNLRQLQLLELSTGHWTAPQVTPLKEGGANGVPPIGAAISQSSANEATGGGSTKAENRLSGNTISLGRKERPRSGFIRDSAASNGTCIS